MRKIYIFRFAQPFFPVTVWYILFYLLNLMPHKFKVSQTVSGYREQGCYL